MHHITVRRHQADETRSLSDFTVHAEDTRKLDHHLRDLLRTAQAERGTGVWSNADPEVWIGVTFVGRLGPGGDIAQLAHLAIEDLNASIASHATR
jgi:hypothetical protein